MTDVSTNGHAKAKRVKAAPNAKATSKAVKAVAKAAKANKTRKTRTVDPAKLDKFGLRQGSIKSRAAAMYASKKGATLADVKAAVGSVQFNVIKELEGKGFTIERDEVPGKGARAATRYHLLAQ